MPEVLILSGPPGSGKSSVARALADRYDRVAHIEVDMLRHFVTATGYVAPGKSGFDRQQRLATRNACSLARNFLEERFAVIIDDVVVEREHLQHYLDDLRDAAASVHFVRLLPGLETVLARNQERDEGRMPAERVEKVWRDFEAAGDIGGVSVDSTGQTAAETADKLQSLTTSGASLVWSPAPAAAHGQPGG